MARTSIAIAETGQDVVVMRRPYGTPPLDTRVAQVVAEPANDVVPPSLDLEGPNAAAFVANVLDAVRDVGAARRELLGRLRGALERGDDQAALKVAAQLVGLE